jgi:hypothetical protein
MRQRPLGGQGEWSGVMRTRRCLLSEGGLGQLAGKLLGEDVLHRQWDDDAGRLCRRARQALVVSSIYALFLYVMTATLELPADWKSVGRLEPRPEPNAILSTPPLSS